MSWFGHQTFHSSETWYRSFVTFRVVLGENLVLIDRDDGGSNIWLTSEMPTQKFKVDGICSIWTWMMDKKSLKQPLEAFEILERKRDFIGIISVKHLSPKQHFREEMSMMGEWRKTTMFGVDWMWKNEEVGPIGKSLDRSANVSQSGTRGRRGSVNTLRSSQSSQAPQRLTRYELVRNIIQSKLSKDNYRLVNDWISKSQPANASSGLSYSLFFLILNWL